MRYILKNKENFSLLLFLLLVSLCSGSASAMKRSLNSDDLFEEKAKKSKDNSVREDHTLYYMPIDVWSHIFSYFDIKELRQAIFVNNQWSIEAKKAFSQTGHLQIKNEPEENIIICHIIFGDNINLKKVSPDFLPQFLSFANTITITDLPADLIKTLLLSFGAQARIENLCIQSADDMGLYSEDSQYSISSKVISKILVNLKNIKIFSPYFLKSKNFAELAQLNLESVVLQKANLITDENISSFTGVSEKLCLFGAAITGSGLSIIARNNPNIKTLILNGARGITADSLSNISFPKLEMISLENIDLSALSSNDFLKNQYSQNLIFKYGPTPIAEGVRQNLLSSGINCKQLSNSRRRLTDQFDDLGL